MGRFVDVMNVVADVDSLQEVSHQLFGCFVDRSTASTVSVGEGLQGWVGFLDGPDFDGVVFRSELVGSTFSGDLNSAVRVGWAAVVGWSGDDELRATCGSNQIESLEHLSLQYGGIANLVCQKSRGG